MAQADNRQRRGEATRDALMRAAESLAAERGIANISRREIVTRAGQKNESALQYHFGGLPGLIEAMHQQRHLEIQQERQYLLEEFAVIDRPLQLRDACRLMVEPVFRLARSRPDFRQYVAAFGNELSQAGGSALARASRQGGGGTSGRETGRILQLVLSHLDDDHYEFRMDSAIRLSAVAMTQEARRRGAFRGRAGDRFLQELLDALEGLLGQPVSRQTRALS